MLSGGWLRPLMLSVRPMQSVASLEADEARILLERLRGGAERFGQHLHCEEDQRQMEGDK
ncbi:hypothetical protein SBV1_230026 [Verrucomicrobia bacterium]|nr:hypothetical protein SBV1_230026 [Verrucomicrobiota bacterium]